jgi:ribosomal protein S3AE
MSAANIQPQEQGEQKEALKKEVGKPKAPTTTKVLKGKSWFAITAPALFSNRSLGEALAADPSTLVGRVVSASLLELTGDPTRYYMMLHFKVTSWDGSSAKTVYVGHETTRDFTARIVQLRTARIDTNDVLQFADGSMRVKSIAITNRPVTESVNKAVRAQIRQLIAEAAKGKTIEQFIEVVMKGELQANVHQAINKLYPLRMFEVLKTEVQ